MQGRECVRVRQVVWTLAAGLAGVVLCGLSPARAAAPLSALDEDAAQNPRHLDDNVRYAPAPPALLARTAVPAIPVAAVSPAALSVVAQGGVVRIIPPAGSEPGVLWLLAMGAVLCRVGARVLRVS